MFDLLRIQKAIHEENLDGWLFVNFAHRDALTDSILGLDPDSVSTRRWFYIVPASGSPLKLVSTLEDSILAPLPGDTTSYYAKKDLETALSFFSGKTIAVLEDPAIQVLSTIDAASVDLVRSIGIKTVSAASLVQRVHGLLDAQGIKNHETAIRVLLSIVKNAWSFVESSLKANKTLHEGDVQDFMLSALSRANLVTNHPPIVASGPNSANPHFSIEGKGRRIGANEVLQFDIWAKSPGGIYADISWVGFTGYEVPKRVDERFKILLEARDLVQPAIQRSFSAGIAPIGAELDALVREFLFAHFPNEAIRHRTGHGIDTECHGAGVNLDSVEFPDSRTLLEGSCFSVEPGAYFETEGFRTEIDIYIQDAKPILSGGISQSEILKFKD
jgi:Xaa-Pro aminopeptidase